MQKLNLCKVLEIKAISYGSVVKSFNFSQLLISKNIE